MTKNKKAVLVTYLCPRSLKKELDNYCSKQGQSKSEVIRRAIRIAIRVK